MTRMAKRALIAGGGIAELVDPIGARVIRGSLTAVDTPRRLAVTADGTSLA